MTSRPQPVDDPLLELLGDLTGMLDLDEFRSGLLIALRRVISADWISLNDIGPEPEMTAVAIDPPFPAEAHELFARHAHENPLLIRYQRTQDGRAYRFSDVTTPRELHATALYREFYGPIGLEHQIAFTLPAAPDQVLALALSRRGRDFSNDERDLLNRARPFLIQFYRNAVEHTQLRITLERRARDPELPLADPAFKAALAKLGVTAREAEILSLVATGISDREAAELAGLSERTVHKHLQRCYAKLSVHTRAEAIAVARTLVDESFGTENRGR